MTPVIGLLFALLAQPAPAADAAPPPTGMIDFLGRRRLCLELPPSAERSAADQAEWRRLACASLGSEERSWRDHVRGNAAALAWLDGDPRDFHLPGIMVRSWGGPPGAYVHRMEWTGTENGGPAAFHLSIDSDDRNGAATLFTASYGDIPARSLRIDNARFPWLDLQSVSAALGSDELRVDIRFGYRRGYCGLRDDDDRPRFTIIFHRDRVSARYQELTNCEVRSVDLAPL